jgi:glycosyltransferase involved in cell wall biosynthesis
MQTLVVTESLPWGTFGGGMRIRRTARVLGESGPVDLIAFPHKGTPGWDTEPSGFRRMHLTSHTEDIAGTRERFIIEMPEWIRTTRYDVVWYNREESWIVARGLVHGPAVIDVDDLPDVLLRRWLDLGRNVYGTPLTPADEAAMTSRINWWNSVHQQAARSAKAIVFSSEQDRGRFSFDNALVVPNSYECEDPSEMTPVASSPPTVLFQGMLDWPPNEDAAIWLAEDIAPRIRASHAGLRVVLPGRPSPRVHDLSALPGTEVPGPVPSMHPYLASASLVVVPLRVGGGTRIKILEAFAHRVPVVATSIGAEGLAAVAGVHLEIADTADEIAGHCVRLLRDRVAATRLADAAYDLYQRRYRTDHAAARVRAVIRACTSGRPSMPLGLRAT